MKIKLFLLAFIISSIAYAHKPLLKPYHIYYTEAVFDFSDLEAALKKLRPMKAMFKARMVKRKSLIDEKKWTKSSEAKYRKEMGVLAKNLINIQRRILKIKPEDAREKKMLIELSKVFKKDTPMLMGFIEKPKPAPSSTSIDFKTYLKKESDLRKRLTEVRATRIKEKNWTKENEVVFEKRLKESYLKSRKYNMDMRKDLIAKKKWNTKFEESYNKTMIEINKRLEKLK